MKIRDVMTANPEGISSDGKCVGIVSLGDIATKSDTPLKGEAIAAVSEPSSPRR